jgi:ketosteroid isomerase-like protein
MSDARSLIERAIAAWGSTDRQAVIPVYEPDAVFDSRPIAIDPRLAQGHHEIQEAVAAWMSNWQRFAWEIVDLARFGDDLFLAEYRGEGISKAGVPVTPPALFHVITTTPDGRIARVICFLDRGQAEAEAERPQNANGPA